MPCEGTLDAHGPRPRRPRMWRGVASWTAATIGRPAQCRRSRGVRQARRYRAVSRTFSPTARGPRAPGGDRRGPPGRGATGVGVGVGAARTWARRRRPPRNRGCARSRASSPGAGRPLRTRTCPCLRAGPIRPAAPAVTVSRRSTPAHAENAPRSRLSATACAIASAYVQRCSSHVQPPWRGALFYRHPAGPAIRGRARPPASPCRWTVPGEPHPADRAGEPHPAADGRRTRDSPPRAAGCPGAVRSGGAGERGQPTAVRRRAGAPSRRRRTADIGMRRSGRSWSVAAQAAVTST